MRNLRPGDESTGVLLGCAMCGTSVFLEKPKRRLDSSVRRPDGLAVHVATNQCWYELARSRIRKSHLRPDPLSPSHEP